MVGRHQKEIWRRRCLHQSSMLSEPGGLHGRSVQPPGIPSEGWCCNLTLCIASCVSTEPLWLLQVAYNQTLHLNGAEASLDSTSAFSPANIFGWGNEDVKDSGGAPIPWERFWAADSPFLRDGCARLELQLSVPPS